MVDISVATQNMQQALNSFNATDSTCTNINNQLQSTVASLGQGWTGEVAVRFQSVMVQWENDFNRVLTALKTMERTLTDNVAQYSRTNANADQLVAGLPRATF